MKTLTNPHQVAGVLFLICGALYVVVWLVSGKLLWLSLGGLHVAVGAVFIATGKSAASNSTPATPPDDDRPR